LEEEYRKYQIRLMISNLSVFYVLFILVCVSFLAVELIFVTVRFYVLPTKSNFAKLTFMQNLKGIYFDLITRQLSFTVVLIILSVNFCENFVTRHRWVMIFTSVLSAYVVVAMGKRYNYRSTPLDL